MKTVRNKTVIILLGPTGAGKTGCSLLLAKALKTEIISADSMLVYRHMDIGTAKPAGDELKAVPHHLINILEPDETFSAGLFRKKAVEIIDDLHGKGMVPLIVGGTGLYIRSLTGGLFDGPAADWSFREKLMDEEGRMGEGHLYRKLRSVDPGAAEQIDPHDVRRIVRTLEIIEKEKKDILKCRRTLTEPSHYRFIKIGLSRERKELYRLIEERVDRMMQDGLLEETEKILGLRPDRTAQQALGYKEIALYLNGNVDLEEAVRLIKKRTKMFAKRQFTWFRKEPDIQWVDITGIMDSDGIFEKVINDVTILKKHLR